MRPNFPVSALTILFKIFWCHHRLPSIGVKSKHLSEVPSGDVFPH
ncbi:MAG: hypothetical protein JWM61_2682 [Micrococcaceae bacterium]|nr:hypothetical protein [Micrococcaceae bacterium]